MSLVNDIYQIYPIHRGKGAALKSIEKALARLGGELKNEGREVGNEGEWLKERTSAFKESDAGKIDGMWDGYNPPYPATWFNQSRYLDEQEQYSRKGRNGSTRLFEERKKARAAIIARTATMGH